MSVTSNDAAPANRHTLSRSHVIIALEDCTFGPKGILGWITKKHSLEYASATQRRVRQSRDEAAKGSASAAGHL